MILSDIDIQTRAQNGMIAPFIPEQIRQAADTGLNAGALRISYGLTSGGYDFRLCPAAGLEIRDPWAGRRTAIDPKNFDAARMTRLRLYTDLNNDQQWWELPGQTFGLALTIETFHIPRDIIGVAVGKSTYARCGIFLNTTPAEPGWQGRLVVELFNSSPDAVRIYANEGIGQMLFNQLSTLPSVSYDERPEGGKYQNQQNITYAKV
jgi:dCTP deaminase